MKSSKIIATVAIISTVFFSCQSPSPDVSNEVATASAEPKEKALMSEVMTKSSQADMTPQAVLDNLMAGNDRYINNELVNRDLPAQVKATTTGQFPKAVVLSCIDSRVPVEMVFDQGVGDIFVARVAGNVEDKDLLGSMEYGLGVAGSKLLLVMGHESCGAVKSAIDKVDVGSENVDHLLAQVEPAISSTDGERNSKDKGFVETVIKNNVKQTIEDIRERSDIIRQLEEAGTIKVVGAYYSLSDGKVSLIK